MLTVVLLLLLLLWWWWLDCSAVLAAMLLVHCAQQNQLAECSASLLPVDSVVQGASCLLTYTCAMLLLF